jgi:hypothetical protein
MFVAISSVHTTIRQALEADNIDCFLFNGCLPGKDRAYVKKEMIKYLKWLTTVAHENVCVEAHSAR